MESIEISPAMMSGLRGIVTAHPVKVGDVVTVNGVDYKALQVRKILLSYHARRNVLTIRSGHYYFTGFTNRLKFLNAVGFSTMEAFMAEHMKDPVFVFSMAESTRNFVDFYEPFY